ncbi:hypothetical protein GUG37_08085, partial [Xanthomonas citri pv. citri]|nr:hypothetical protein [Xanthomonas citri pv. citri]
MPPQRKASAFSLWWQSITQPAATLQHPSVRDAVPEGAALLGDEQMEALGHSLAQAHVLYTGPTR